MKNLTRLLNRTSGSANKLLPLVYKPLRKQAAAQMRSEPKDHTLQPTALVHEAFLRIMKNPDIEWDNRAHFYGAAAQAMRRILVERARRVQRIKHGGTLERSAFLEFELGEINQAEELLALDEALDLLVKEYPRKAKVVELRYYGGLSVVETAETLSVSQATVKLDWKFARAWLQSKLTEPESVVTNQAQ